MSQQVKVSVIIPIYNNEDYLRNCIDSIVNQSFRELEIILIDDGSEDKASEICDEYAREDERIIVIHKENEGSAAARNQGVDIARGRYIAFVESDDVTDTHMYEELYYRAIETNADIVKCGFFKKRRGLPATEIVDFYSVGKDCEVFKAKERPEIFALHASIWSGLYSHDFLTNNSLRFLVTPSATYSDYSFMAMTYAHAERITVVNKALYYYTIDNIGSSTLKQGKNYKYMIYHASEANRILRDAGIYNDVSKYIALQTFKTCIDGTAFGVSDAEKHDYFMMLCELFNDMLSNTANKVSFWEKEWEKMVVQAVISGNEDSFFDVLLNKYKLNNPEKFYGKRIAIFGAGVCGKCYIKQLEDCGIKVSTWIDNNPKKELGVIAPKRLENEEYDVVLIAVANMDIADEMIKQLQDIGVSKDIIYFEMPGDY